MLLEREDVLLRLDALASEAAESRGRVVFLGGEAGVGKSTVIRATMDAAPAHLAVSLGHCDNVAASALGPLVDAMPDVAQLLDEAMERPVLFRRLLERLATAPALLVLEDIHWADEATRDFLRFLGRRIESLPLLLVATFRDDEVGAAHPLSVTLGDLASSSAVERIGLTALSLDGVRRLVSEAGSHIDPHLLHHRTGGNPFYVTEVLASGDENVPTTVRDAVLARVSLVSDAARRVLHAAAVLEQPASLALLGDVAGEQPAAVDECVVAGVLVARGRTWGFRHELARLSVESTIPPARRSALHAAALASLLARGEDDAHRLVWHAENCGDSEAVLRYAVPAAERSSRLGAHHEAAVMYRHALGHHLDRDAVRADLCAALSYECYLIDHLEEALEARHESMELSEDPVAVGDAERWLSRLSWYLGRGQDARIWMERSVQTLEAVGEGPELAMAYSNRAQLCMLAYDAEGAVEWGTRALAMARRVGDRETEIHALNNVGTAMAHGEDYLQGITLLEQSRDLALAADAPEHAARAYTNLSSASVTTRHLSDAARHLRVGIAYCQERDLDSWLHYMRAWEPRVAEEQGDLDSAHQLAVDLLGLHDLPPIVRVPALAAAARTAHRLGRDGQGWLDEAVALARPTGEAQRLVPVAVARAERWWLAGQVDRIESEVDLAWHAAVEHPQNWEVGELCWWLRAGGVRRPAPLPPAEPFRLMLDEAWLDAAEVWRGLGVPYWEALALAHAGELDAARRALQLLDDLGAGAAREAVVRDRRAAGLPVPRGPRTRQGGTDLTPREHDVLVLLAEGLSDAGIAEALVLSRKTVGHHVSAVLRKLDAPSRSRAVATAARLGILGSD